MSSSAPLVTILTPTYNHELFLGQCLASVAAQTEDRWEQIVIDDGSNDGTGEIARTNDDPRVRYVRQGNAGIYRLAQTLNRFLATARGEFIAVLSGDDYWPVDKLEQQIASFDNPEVILSWGRARVVDRHGEVLGAIPSKRSLKRTQGSSRGAMLASLVQQNLIPAGTVVCRRTSLLAIGGFQQPDGVPFEDYATWLDLSRIGLFAASDRILCSYRRHEGQVTFQMLQEMKANGEWVGQYVDRLDRSELWALGVGADELRGTVEKKRAALQAMEGRAMLQEGRSADATEYFRSARRQGSTSTRLRAVLGLASARFGFDLERAYGPLAQLRDRLAGIRESAK